MRKKRSNTPKRTDVTMKNFFIENARSENLHGTNVNNSLEAVKRQFFEVARITYPSTTP
jgi:hypothetical protein